MRTSSACVALLVLSSAFGAVACTGDDDPTAAATNKDNPPVPTTSGSSGGATPGTSGAPGDSGTGVEPKEQADAGSDSGVAPGEAGQIIGYVYGSIPSADSSPSPNYAYNAGGGAMKITRTGVGAYDVSFAGLDLTGSVALVSGYDMAGGLCMWGGTTSDAVTVRCYDAGGSIIDAKFSLTVFGKGAKGASILGFAHANDKSAASYTPQASRSNNAVGGGAITATRSAKGTYAIEFAGLSLLDIGNVQVMPYGDPSAFCTIESWIGPKVNVTCYDNDGNLADAQYTVMLLGQKAGATAKVVAYAHAADAANASYAPVLSYNDGDAVTATRLSTGNYKIVFDGLNLNTGAHVQVTSEGKGRRCNVGAWAGNTVDLTCMNGSGTPSDNNYAIVVVQ